jgi:hypothetical protein
MPRIMNRRLLIGVRTACAATAAYQHRECPPLPVGEMMAVYETVRVSYRCAMVPVAEPETSMSRYERNGAAH